MKRENNERATTQREEEKKPMPSVQSPNRVEPAGPAAGERDNAVEVKHDETGAGGGQSGGATKTQRGPSTLGHTGSSENRDRRGNGIPRN